MVIGVGEQPQTKAPRIKTKTNTPENEQKTFTYIDNASGKSSEFIIYKKDLSHKCYVLLFKSLIT